jgi:mRNA interferase MazF
MSGINPKRGQVWWVSHDPAFGSEPAMARPGIVVSDDDHNEFMPTVTVCPMTSSIKRVYDFEVFVPEGDGGVPKDSKVQPQLVRAISKSRLLELIGEVSETTLALVDEGLKLHFGFHRQGRNDQ